MDYAVHLRACGATVDKEKIGCLVPVFFPVEPVHHRLNAFSDEQFGGVRGAAHRLGDIGPLIRIELRQHVIREIAGVSTPDPYPQPCKFFGPERADNRLQAVVAASRSRRPRPQTPQLQIRVVDHDEEIRQVDLVEPEQSPTA